MVAGGIKVCNQLNLREEDQRGLPGWAQCNHKGLETRKRQKSQNQRDDIIRKTHRAIVAFQGGRSHELSYAGSLQKLEKANKQTNKQKNQQQRQKTLPSASGKEHGPTNTLNLVH